MGTRNSLAGNSGEKITVKKMRTFSWHRLRQRSAQSVGRCSVKIEASEKKNAVKIGKQSAGFNLKLARVIKLKTKEQNVPPFFTSERSFDSWWHRNSVGDRGISLPRRRTATSFLKMLLSGGCVVFGGWAKFRADDGRRQKNRAKAKTTLFGAEKPLNCSGGNGGVEAADCAIHNEYYLVLHTSIR